MTCPACGSQRADDQLMLFGVCDPCRREMDAEREIVDYRDEDFDNWVEDLAEDACERPGSAHLAFGDDAAAALAKELEEAAKLALEENK